MRRFNGSVRLASALALGLMLSGCESFDMSSVTSFLDTKKPLPGERRAVFPEGVPGVAQGVPPEMVKGSEAQTALAAPEPQAEAKPAPEPVKPKSKPRPKPRTAAAPKPAPAPVEERAPASRPQPAAASPWPSSPQPQQQQPAASPWPSSQPQQQRPSTSWPEPRPAGTFTPQ